VLLAWLDPDESEALARSSLATYDGREDLEAARMRRQLAGVRARGWAFTDGERETGVASVAAPVRDRFGMVVAALVLAGPSTRLGKPSARQAAAQLTTEAAARVSRGLGHLDETDAREGA
jgi:IclR family transcriptional regulator, acetate operon repressor